MEERKPLRVLGLDVSQSIIDYAHSNGELADHVANDAAGVEQLIDLAKAHADLVVCEATGGYERLAVARFLANGIAVAVVQSAPDSRFREGDRTARQDGPDRCSGDRGVRRRSGASR